MRELIGSYLSKNLSRRGLFENLVALGFTAAAAESLIRPVEAAEAVVLTSSSARGGERVGGVWGGRECVGASQLLPEIFGACDGVTHLLGRGLGPMLSLFC